MREPTLFAPSVRVGSFTICHEMRRGGTAIIYYAENENRRRAIVKLLRPERQNDERAVAGLQREIIARREVARDLIEAGDVYFVSDFHKGSPLRLKLDEMCKKHGGWVDHESYGVFKKLAEHLAGFSEHTVHCDLKPENVLLIFVPGGNDVQIIDYGACLLEGDQRVRADEGTPEYESPEQCDPESAHQVSAASDRYALGVMMYEAHAGRPPFVHADRDEVRRMHVEDEVDFDRLRKRGCPDTVVEVIRSLLDKDPTRRMSARQVALRLELLAVAPEAIAAAGSSRFFQGQVERYDVDRQWTRTPWLYLAVAATVASSALVAARTLVRPPPIAPPRAVSAMPTPIIEAVIPRATKHGRPPRPLTPRQVKEQCSWFKGTEDECIPGGYFAQGLDAAHVDELCQLIGSECTPAVREQLMRAIPIGGEPLRTWVSTFGIGKTVSCQQWAAYLEQLRQNFPEDFDVAYENEGDPPRRRYPTLHGKRIYDLVGSGTCVVQDPKTLQFSAIPGLANRPVDMVSWFGANSYCEDHHGKLPTEAQLERVRRWNNAWPYVWGAEKPACDRVSYDQPAIDSLGIHIGECRNLSPMLKGTRDLGSSPLDLIAGLGLTDLGGNVRHWTRDGFVSHLPPCPGGVCVDPVMPAQPSGLFGMLGGSYTFPSYYMFSAFRGQYKGQSNEHGSGFLCVKEVPVSSSSKQ